jgi:hypothetical protein
MSNGPQTAFDHSGSSFDSFLAEEGIYDEVELVAIERVNAWEGNSREQLPLGQRVERD